MKPKQDLAGYFNKMEGQGAADEENKSPLPRFLNSVNSERQEIKKQRLAKA
jgi:hypothetical protein